LGLVDGPRVDLRTAQDDASLRELALSIKASGLLQPIGVVAGNGRYRVVYGNRRYLASRLAGVPTLDCKILTGDEVSELEMASVENMQRRDLTPVEEARALRLMVDGQGRSVEDISAAVGRSPSWVRQRLDVLRWPSTIVDLIHAGTLSVAVARELVLVEDESTRAVYTNAAIESGVTAAQCRQWRLEWEVTKALPPAPELGGGFVPLGTQQVVPHVGCAACGVLIPVTAARFVRLDPDCAEILDEIGRQGGFAKPVGGPSVPGGQGNVETQRPG
jgi:ParB/RepB/Spo0J family partition protein